MTDSTSSSTAHLDLDALADLAAGVADDRAASHAVDCARCTGAAAELRRAEGSVLADLRALPLVPPPAGLADALVQHARQAVQQPPATVTTLPTPRRQPRLLAAAAALTALALGVGVAVSALRDGSQDGDAGSTAAAPAAVARSATGTDYAGRDQLVQALPGLLRGSTSAAADAEAGTTLDAPAAPSALSRAAGVADPLARLRTAEGLADCLLALLPPDQPDVRPLALDYASFHGQPALVVVIPSAAPSRLDVFVVGPTCSRASDSTLFYTAVDRP